MPLALAVHGGAGRADPELAAGQRAGLERAARRAMARLGSGGAALDAVVEAVACLEDDEHFNAGYGSVLSSEGTVEMDASVMDGRSLAAGAVGAVTGVRHPVRLALAVLRRTPHLLIVGPSARRLAEAWALELCAPEALVAPRQRQRFADLARSESGSTVGAVALDAQGHVAAATSTGGVFGKLPGRVGDSAVIGAGTYADDGAGAVSATGCGEAIIKAALAKSVCELLRGGMAPDRAAAIAIGEFARRLGADAGVIAVDRFGRVGYATSAPQMSVAWWRAGMEDICAVVAGRNTRSSGR